jgi:uncharacterized protein DUF4397
MGYLRNSLGAVCAAAIITALATASASATIAPRTVPVGADATLIQGLPKTSVNVWVNGTDIIQDFRFKGVVGPLPLLPGSYHVVIRLHGAKAATPPLLSETVVLAAGENITMVAGLTPAAVPALTNFTNPDPALVAGRTDLLVRNVAADPGLNVYASGLFIFGNLTNPNESHIRLPEQWVKIRMTIAGSPATVIGPLWRHLRSQTVTIIYAVGSAATKTLSSVQQTYSVS